MGTRGSRTKETEGSETEDTGGLGTEEISGSASEVTGTKDGPGKNKLNRRLCEEHATRRHRRGRLWTR